GTVVSTVQTLPGPPLSGFRRPLHVRVAVALSPGVPDSDGPNFSMRYHRAPPVRQTAIAGAFRSLQVIEYLSRANKQARIDRIVIFEVLSDRRNAISVRLDLHRIH